MKKAILQIEVELDEDIISEKQLTEQQIKERLERYPTTLSTTDIVNDYSEFKLIRIEE